VQARVARRDGDGCAGAERSTIKAVVRGGNTGVGVGRGQRDDGSVGVGVDDVAGCRRRAGVELELLRDDRLAVSEQVDGVERDVVDALSAHAEGLIVLGGRVRSVGGHLSNVVERHAFVAQVVVLRELNLEG